MYRRRTARFTGIQSSTGGCIPTDTVLAFSPDRMDAANVFLLYNSISVTVFSRAVLQPNHVPITIAIVTCYLLYRECMICFDTS